MVSAVLVHGTGSIGARHLRVLGAMGTPALAMSVRRANGIDTGARIVTTSEATAIGLMRIEGAQVVDSIAAAVDAGATSAIIATSTGRHLDDATAALRAGLDLLVEKPLAASTRGLADLDRVARDAGRRVFVGCCLRFDAALLRFRALLPQIGAIDHVRIECRSYLPEWRPSTDYRASYSARADEGGVLRDLIHEVDYAAWLFGWPERITGRTGNSGELGIESEEWAELEWVAPAAKSVSIRLDYLTTPARRVMRAQGENGTLEVDLIAHRVVLELVGEAAYTADVVQARDEMMTDQTRAFLSAIQGGDPGQLATLEDGARALAICDAARLGAQSVVGDWRSA
jgi:predicted dehydrogenase